MPPVLRGAWAHVFVVHAPARPFQDGGAMTFYLVSMVGASPDVRCAVGAALQVYAEAVD